MLAWETVNFRMLIFLVTDMVTNSYSLILMLAQMLQLNWLMTLKVEIDLSSTVY